MRQFVHASLSLCLSSFLPLLQSAVIDGRYFVSEVLLSSGFVSDLQHLFGDFMSVAVVGKAEFRSRLHGGEEPVVDGPRLHRRLGRHRDELMSRSRGSRVGPDYPPSETSRSKSLSETLSQLESIGRQRSSAPIFLSFFFPLRKTKKILSRRRGSNFRIIKIDENTTGKATTAITKRDRAPKETVLKKD